MTISKSNAEYEKLIMELIDSKNKESKDLFDPENYTERNNPVISCIARELLNATNLGYISSDIKTLNKKCSIEDEKFLKSLSPLQRDLYVVYENNLFEAHEQEELEFFIMGFKIAMNLSREIFGLRSTLNG